MAQTHENFLPSMAKRLILVSWSRLVLPTQISCLCRRSGPLLAISMVRIGYKLEDFLSSLNKGRAVSNMATISAMHQRRFWPSALQFAQRSRLGLRTGIYFPPWSSALPLAPIGTIVQVLVVVCLEKGQRNISCLAPIKTANTMLLVNQGRKYLCVKS